MFVETKREGETQAPDIYSIDTLIAWLEKQPADKAYFWGSCSDCLQAQYARAHGSNYLDLFMGQMARHQAPEFDIALPVPHTFGAALRRARIKKA